jgi:hypothetical protein
VLDATGVSAADATVLLNYGFGVRPTRGFGPWARNTH